MQLLMDGNTYLAKTQYGEWAAKQAGFTWDKVRKVWWTTDQGKAKQLEAQTGLAFVPAQNALPKPAEGDQWPTVEEGRYAITDPADEVLKFYQVDKPKEGRWMGYTFLKVFASDSTYPVKEWETKKRILDAISKEPVEAMKRYGQEIGTCGRCAIILTDSVSRAFGIGPVCRKKMGLTIEKLPAQDAVEATTIGLEPGAWPATITHGGATYHKHEIEWDGEGDVVCVKYINGGKVPTVFND